MRMRLQILLPATIAAAALAACDIPDDGTAELKGTIQIPGTLLPLVIMPSDVGGGSDCAADAETWDDDPAIGDVTPTVFVGLYKKPIDPLNGDFNPVDENAWYKGCGMIDEDDDPVTPAIPHDESCPIGGTTATYVQTIAGTNGGAVFEFEALQLPSGTAYLIAWLDNKCAADNETSANLVWDLGGPPGPLDEKGNEPDDPVDPADPDENDLMNYPPLEVDIGSGSNSVDTIVLNSALTASQL